MLAIASQAIVPRVATRVVPRRRVPTRAASDRADGGGDAAPRLEPSFQRATPPGETHERDVCTTCGFL